MNKEQWVCLAGIGLLVLGVYFTLTGWLPEKEFKPPTIRGGGDKAEKVIEAPLFATEDDGCEFRVEGRDPFQPKRDTEPLPLAELSKPPMPAIKRVAPGPVPGLGHSRLRPLEEALPEGRVDITGGPGEEGGEEEEEEEDDEWGGRRW